MAEPEDHAGILCEIMAGLASGQLPAPAGSDRTIFEKHMAPWIGRFFADLERARGGGILPARRRRSAGCSSKSKPRLSRCRREARAALRLDVQGGLAMKQDSKAKVGRRDFLRVLGAGAGAAVTPAVLVSEAHARFREQR